MTTKRPAAETKKLPICRAVMPGIIPCDLDDVGGVKGLKEHLPPRKRIGKISAIYHVNYDLPENAALATKYGVTGSSLWIGVYDANGFDKEENIKVWYLINNKEAYSAYLSGIISKRLNGDLS